jgi:hypothetical protein
VCLVIKFKGSCHLDLVQGYHQQQAALIPLITLEFFSIFILAFFFIFVVHSSFELAASDFSLA